jgi:hypothetical protein
MARVATGQGIEGATQEGGALPTLQPALTPLKPKEGQAVAVSVSYPGGVATRLELFYRTRGSGVFSKLTVGGTGGKFATSIPGMDVRAPALEYYAAVLDDNGAAVARAGSLGQPLALDVRALPKPVYRKGWFWGVIGGVVVVGAAVATTVALTTRSNVGPTTPATVTIQPQ